jgi:hypothetical protein
MMATLTLVFGGSAVIVNGSIAIWVGALCTIFAAFNLQVTIRWLGTPGRCDPPDSTAILAMRFH